MVEMSKVTDPGPGGVAGHASIVFARGTNTPCADRSQKAYHEAYNDVTAADIL